MTSPRTTSTPGPSTLEDDSVGDTSSRRRWPTRSWRDWYLVAVIVGVTAFTLGPSLVGARTLLQVNVLTGAYPWRASGAAPYGYLTCAADTINSGMPGIAQTRAQLFGGHLASWQSIVAGGGPLASIPNDGLLDPLSLPYFVLPLWLAPAFVVLLSWAAAIGGTFLFLRRLSLSRPAALLAGLIFATSGFMVMWTNWPQTRVAALVPALFWAVERLVQRMKPTDVVLIAVVVASMLFGGFPAVTGYALYLAAGYLLVRLYMRRGAGLRRSLTTLAMSAGGVVLGFMISAVQMFPFLYWYQHGDLTYRSGDAHRGLPLSGLLTLVAPNANGLCVSGQPMHVLGNPSLFPNGNPIEVVAYVGSAALMLAVAGAAFGLRRGGTGTGFGGTGGGGNGLGGNGRVSLGSGGNGLGGGGLADGVAGYFVAATAVMILIGWASPTARSLVASLPVFAGNFIGRIRSVLGFALAVLAAIGFEWLTRERSRQPRERRTPTLRRDWPVVVWVAAAVTGLVVLLEAHHDADSGSYWHEMAGNIWIPLLLVLASLVVFLMSRAPRPGARTFAFVVVPLLVATQAAQFFHAVVPGNDPKNFYPETPIHKFLATHLGHDRFTASGGMMYPATALYYGLRTPTGHAFLQPTWEELLNRVDPGAMTEPTVSSFGPGINPRTVGRQPILDRMGVKYFVAHSDELAGRIDPLPPATGSVSASARPITCTVPAQPMRGVTVRLAHGLVPASPARGGVTVEVGVSGAGPLISGGRYLTNSMPGGSLLSVGVPGEDIRPGGNLTVTVSATGATAPLVVAASGSQAVCGVVAPIDDGLRLVYSDPGGLVYQRLDAVPRIRWAARDVVIPTPSTRIAALAAGVPADEVVLDTPGPSGSGHAASVHVITDDGDQIAAQVNAAGAGYLVVADAMQSAGWVVTVDGTAANLVPADHAMVAVFVPAGTHRVVFTYTAPDQIKGAVLTGLGIVIAVALLFWSRLSTSVAALSRGSRRRHGRHYMGRRG